MLAPGMQGTATKEPQSLVEVARKEAERRKKIDAQGVTVKRIESADLPPFTLGGAVSVSTPQSRPASAGNPVRKAEARPALRSFQTRLQKLDRDIEQGQNKLKLLRARSDAERWAGTKTSKGSRGSGLNATQDSLRWQILELEAKLAAWRRERSDTFQAGRKAGYLPGELESRGIVR